MAENNSRLSRDSTMQVTAKVGVVLVKNTRTIFPSTGYNSNKNNNNTYVVKYEDL